MIEKIGNVNKPISSTQKNSVKKSSQVSKQTDSVSISAEAHKAAEIAAHVKTVKGSTDPSRAEKIREIKIKLKNGEYDNLNNDMLSKIADRIINSIFA
jgi:anti-sigma28 factor (negative regulator of flagellin synthesis)